ncbi:MAG: SDR family oxidoreductase [Chitinophagales bacterium]|nr:SDR family oxidoreductase [Chitinophagales bacterium]
MNIFIIGASGLVGGNCYHYFKEKKENVIGTHFSYETPYTVAFNTLDINNENNFNIYDFKPDVIIHCGALTHVDYCEQNEVESYEKTVTATKNIVDLAEQLNATLVFISTDYIFDGHDGPYDEQAKPNPISIYGSHKLEAEELVLNSTVNTIVLRITNVYGDEIRGKNFVARIFDQAINQQKLTLKLPTDQFATPINAHDIAKAMYLLLDNKHYGIYNISSTDYMNRVQLALRILSYFPTAQYDLLPMTTNELNPPAQRPLQGGLKNKKFMDLFPDFVFSTIDEYISNKLK